jgi:tRNA threonylcarbamoyladenosine biosynthesis protein TsaE
VVLPFEKIVKDEIETSIVAYEFAQSLKAGDIVWLNGDLGSGKTFFIKKVCSEFGIHTVSSPSFGIVNEYKGKYKIIHLDFYRIKKVEELYDIGFEDYISSGDSIVFIEWAEMFSEVLHKKYLHVKIDYIDDSQRRIKISKHE